MFESAELGHEVDKETFEQEVPILRAALLKAQYEVRTAARFPVVVLINGMDGAGRGETVNLLSEWMDPRYIETRAFTTPTEEERDRPEMWRFWRSLPPKGKTGILFGSWYSSVLRDRLEGKAGDGEAEHRLSDIVRFEQMLADEGVLLVKFWFHLSEKRQKERLKALEADPKTRWRVTQDDWARFKQHRQFVSEGETILRTTSKFHAPWIIIDGSDDRYRSLKVGKILLESMEKRLARPDASRRVAEAPIVHSHLDSRNLLSTLNLDLFISKKKYNDDISFYQEAIGRLVRSPAFQNRSLVLVFEGSDAAGKGGAIRRVAQALDARQYEIIPIAAPTDEERAQPYLWRFWRKLPRLGRVAVFDRSWYGRVLVERVENFCGQADWMRAYPEINDFEEQLVRKGAIVCKFWLAISKEEQLRRFQEREATEFKRFKITEEDWRNREKWDDYAEAVCDMIDRTSTSMASWTLVEANDKHYARVKILKTITEALARELEEADRENVTGSEAIKDVKKEGKKKSSQTKGKAGERGEASPKREEALPPVPSHSDAHDPEGA